MRRIFEKSFRIIAVSLIFFSTVLQGVPLYAVSQTNQSVSVTETANLTVNAINEGDSSISGNGELEASISVFNESGNEIGTTAVSDTGNFTSSLSEEVYTGEVLTVEQTSASGLSTSVDIVVDGTSIPTVNNISASDSLITGTGTKNSIVTITNQNGAVIAKDTVTSGSTYNANVNQTLNANETLYVTQTDLANNESEKVTIIVGSALNNPQVNPVKETDSVVSGGIDAAIPGGNINVYDENNNLITTTLIGTDGTFYANIPYLANGTIINVTQVNSAGTESTPTKVIVGGTNTPVIDEVYSNASIVTGKATPNATVIVELKNGTNVKTTANAEGTYVATLPSDYVLKNNETISVYQFDGDENSNKSSKSTISVIDEISLTVSPINNADNSINVTTITGGVIEVKDEAGNEIGTATSSDINQQTEVKLNREVTSGEKLFVTVNFNNAISPTVEIVVGATEFAPKQNFVNAGDTYVTAEPNSAVPGAEIIIEDIDGKEIGTSIVEEDGSYTTSIPKQADGAELSIKQGDGAGNVSSPTTLVIGKALNAMDLDPAFSANTNLTGKGTPNANITVTVKQTGQELGSSTVDSNGNFSVNIGNVATTTVLTVTQTLNGETTTTNITVDGTLNPPAVATPHPGEYVVYADVGAATINTNINAYWFNPDKQEFEFIGSAPVGQNGQYNINSWRHLNKQGDVICVVHEDQAGNFSEQACVTSGVDNQAPKVDAVNHGATTVTGVPQSAYGYAQIKVYDEANNVLGTSVANQNGSYSVNLNRAVSKGEKLHVTQKSGANSESDPVYVVVGATQNAPLVNPVEVSNTTVTGPVNAAVKNAEIIVRDAGGNIIGNGFVNADGTYTANLTRALVNEEMLFVTQSDLAGHESPSTQVQVGSVLEAPKVNPVSNTDSVVTGSNNAAKPGATVRVYEGATLLGFVTADTNGQYTVNIAPQSVGDVLSVTQSNPGGTESPATNVIVGVSNAGPKVDAAFGGDTNVHGKNGSAVKGASIEVKDTTGAVISAADQPKVDANGAYSVQTTRPLRDGETLYVTQGDGNSKSPATKVVVGVTQVAPLVNPVNANQSHVTGNDTFVKPNATVIVKNKDHQEIGRATANSNGAYDVNLGVPQPASTILYVVQADESGNESPETRVVVNSTLAAPTVNPISANQKNVTGNNAYAVPNATIKVKDASGNVLATGTADGLGAYNLTATSNFTRGQEVFVTQGDQTGESPATKVIVGVADQGPDVNPIKDKEQTVSGDPQGAVPGATISIKDSNNNELVASGQPVVKSDGSYSVQTTRQLNKGETLKVTQGYGQHISPATTVIVGATENGPKVNPITANDAVVTGSNQAAVPGATIIVEDASGTPITKGSQPVVDGNGSYRVETTRPMQKGEKIYVSQSVNGDVSPKTMVIVGIETSAPQVNKIDDKAQNVTGADSFAIPGASIIVYDSQNNIITAGGQPVVNENGSYNVATSRQMNKGEVIYVAQTDGTTISPKTRVVVGASLEAPRVKPVSETDILVSGDSQYAVANADVIVRKNGQEIGRGIANTSGGYVVNIGTPQAAGTVLTVTQSDGNGHESPATTVIVGASTRAPLVNPISTGSTHVTGPQNAAVVGATIKVMDSSQTNVIGTGTVQPGGTYDVTTNRAMQAGEEIYVTQGDGNGTSPATKVIVGATQNAPKVNPINNNDTNISGPNAAAVPNSIITIRDANQTLVKTGTVDSQGSYNINTGRQLHTGEIYYVTQGDGFNESPATKVIVGISNSPVRVNPIASNSQNVTGSATYAIPGANIIVRDSSNNIITAPNQPVVESNGSYNVNTNRQMQRGEEVFVTQTDGNSESTPTRIVVGGTEKPTFDPVAETDKTVTVHGTPNSTITVGFEGGVNVTGVADATGTYVAQVPQNVKLDNGDLITAISSDGLNNSDVATTIVGAENVVVINPLFAGDKTITGTGTPGLTVNIVLPNGQGTRQATVQPNGTWSYTNQDINLVNGDLVSASQTDGTFTSPSTSIIVGGTNAPTISPVFENATKVTGYGVKNSKVIITFPNGSKTEAIVASNGTYQANVPSGVVLKKGDVVSAVQTDNISTSQSVSVIVGATTPPALNDVYSGANVITGTGIPGATVYANEFATSTTVDQNGDWSIPVPSGTVLKKGDIISVKQFDNQNWSAPTIKFVIQLEKPKVKAINENDTKVSVSGTQGTTIVATSSSGQQIGTLDVQSTNQYADMSLTRGAIDGEIITFVTTKNGANSEPVNVVVGATLNAPNVNGVNNGATTVTGNSGAAKYGTTIIVSDASGNPIGTGITNPDGSYSVNVPVQTTGNKLSVVQEDGAGNKSPATNVIVGIGQSTVKVNPVNNGDRKVTGNQNAAIPGASIVVYDSIGNPVGTGNVSGDGSYTANTNRAMVRGEVITVVQTDFNTESLPVNIVVGGIEKPTIEPVISTDTLITVTSTPNAIITLTLPGNVVLTQTASNEGVTVFNVPSSVVLKDGDLITAVASDGQNLSEVATAVVGAENSVFINPIYANDKTITGTGTPGLTVDITLPGSQGVKQTTVQPNGQWTITDNSMSLNKGNVVTATQTDGVTTSKPASVVVNGTDTPTINPVSNTDTVVSGIGTPNATVEITFANNAKASTVVNSNGTYEVSVPAGVTLTRGELVTARQSDGLSISNPVSVIISGAEQPTVDQIYAGATTITGTGTPNASINVLAPAITTKVDANGKWTAVVPQGYVLKAGDIVSVTQSDNVNTSTPVQVTVLKLASPVVDPVDPGVTTVIADGTINTELKVYDSSNAQIGTKTVTGDGQNQTIILSRAAIEKEVLTVYSYHNGAMSDPVNVVVGATQNAPKVNPVNNGATKVTGSANAAIPGATITVRHNDIVIGTGIVGTDGSYSVTVPTQVTGNKLAVTQGDGATNESPATNVIVGIAEGQVKVNPIKDQDQVVTGPNQGAITGATIVVTDSTGAKLGESTVNTNGDYSVPTSRKMNRGEIVTVVQTDGNSQSQPVNIVVGGTEKPVIDSILDTDTVVTVHATPNAIVTVTFENGAQQTGVANAEGIYEAIVPGNVKLENGDLVTAVASDGQNTSDIATAVVGAENGVTIEPLFAGNKTIKGTGTPGLEVNIVLPNGQGTKKTTVDQTGSWTYTDNNMVLNKGDIVSATQTDGTTTSAPASVVVNGTDAPTIEPVFVNSRSVTGKGTPNATVIVTFQNNTTAQAVVNTNGDYTVSVPSNVTLNKGDIVSAVQTDGMSTSNSVSVIVGATQPPGVNKVYAGSTQVKGTGIPGARVTITEFGVSTTVDQAGNWTIDVPAGVVLKVGDPITAIQNDNQNDSAPMRITVEKLEKPTVKAINPGNTKASVSGTVNTDIVATDSSNNVIGTLAVTKSNTFADMSLNRAAVEGEVITFVSTNNGARSETVEVVVGTTLLAPKVNGVNNADTVVTGPVNAAVKGSNVIVKNEIGNEIGRAVVQPDGSYSVTVPAQSTGNKLSVVQEDRAGNISPATNVIVGIGQSQVKVNPINDKDKKVTGNNNAAIPGATINVFDASNNKIGTGIVGSNGEYTVNTTRDMNRGEIITVVQTDLNTESSPVNVVVGGIEKPVIESVLNTDTTVTVRSTPNALITLTLPGNVVLNGVADENGVTTFNVPNNVTLKDGDMITAVASDGQNNSEMAIAIVGAENGVYINPIFANDKKITGTGVAGLTVNVTLPGGQGVKQTTVNQNGEWSIEDQTMRLNKGDIVSATQTDGVTTSQPATVVVSGTDTPTINPVSTTDTKVTGTGTANATVELTFANNTKATTIVNANGTYEATVPAGVTLTRGELVTARQSDGLSISNPVSVIISGAEQPTVDQIYAGATTITGKGTPNATINIAQPAVSTKVDSSGNWTAIVPQSYVLSAGDIVSVTQNDNMNTSTPVLTTVLELPSPVVDPVNPSATTVVADGTVNTELRVYDSSNTQIGTKSVTGDGQNQSITLSRPAIEKEVLTVYSYHNGATSKPVNVIVGATLNAPQVNPVNNGATTVTGSANAALPGSVITVRHNGIVIGTGVAGTDGSYSVTVPAQITGNKLAVTQGDGAGNESPARNIIVGISESQIKVNPIKDQDQVVTGPNQGAIAGATIVVTDSTGAKLGESTVNSNGDYSVPTSRKMNRGEIVTVVQTDGSSQSQPVNIVVGGTEKPVIDSILDTDSTVIVHATPNSMVTVTFENGATQSGIANAEGIYTAQVPASVTLENGDIVTAVSSDGQNTSEMAMAVVGAENGVTINPLFANDTTISGTGVNGLTVNVVLPNGQGTKQTTVQANGVWTLTDSSIDLNKGDIVSATQTDGTTVSSPASVVVNGTDAPTINPVFVNTKSITGKGTPNATVLLTFEDNTTAQGTVDANGNYSIAVPNSVNLSQGDEVVAVQTDGQSLSDSVSVIVDATNNPTVDNIYAGSTVITGTGIPNATIRIEELGVNTTVTQNGTWSINVPNGTVLNTGDTITAIQNDNQNDSEPVSKIVLELAKPNVKAVNPGNTKANVSGVENTAIIATDSQNNQLGTINVTNTDQFIDLQFNRAAIEGEVIKFVSTNNGAVSEAVYVVVGTTLLAPQVNPVNNGDTVVTGNDNAVIKGSNVIVRDEVGNTIGTGVAIANGSYSVTVPAQVTGNKLSIVQEDGAGNESPATNIIVGISESQIQVNPINDGDEVVTGNEVAAIPGATINVYDEANVLLGTDVVAANGEYAVDTNREMNRGEIITVIQTDSNTQSQPVEIVVGGIEKPIIDSVVDTDTQVTVRSTANAEVTLTLPGNVVLKMTADQNGVSVFNVPSNVTLKNGDMITAVAYDGQNTSEMAIAIVGAENMVTIDPVFAGDTQITGTGVVGLEVEVVLPNGQGSLKTTTNDKGIWSVENDQMRLYKGDEISATQTDGVTTSEPATVIVDATDSPTIDPVGNTAKKVTGTGTPNATIYVEFSDATIVETVVNSEGIYTANVPSNVVLTSGEMVYAIQSDRQNISEKVGVIIGGAEVPVINTVYAGSNIVTGTGTPNATVTSLSGEVTTVVDKAGNFSVAVPSNITLNVDDVIIATQTDGMNVSEQGMRVVELLEKPVVMPVNPIDTKVTVKGTAETTIVIENDKGQVIGSNVVQATNEAFDINISEAVQTGDVLTVYATHNGAVSEMVYVVVGATIDAPIVDPVNAGDNVVTGEGVPGATIIVTDKDGNIIGTGVVGPNGEYTVDVPTQNAGNELSVWQEDGAGNKSPSTDVIVGINESQLLVNPINDKDQVVSGNELAGIANATIIVTDSQNIEIGRGLVNVDGSYSISTSRQMIRGEAITVTQTDLNTNSAPVTIIVGGIDKPVIAPVSIDDEEVNVSSTANVDVTIGFENGSSETIKADENGSTIFAVPNNVTLQNGDIITAVANDGQNNSETAYAVVGAETMVMIDPIHAGDTTITGEAIPNLEVNVTLPNGQGIETTNANANGEWTITNDSMKLVRGDEVSATQTDGVTTSAPATIIVDGTMNPTINPVANQDKVVTGTGTPNATVIVKFANGVTEQGIVNNDGIYSIKVPNDVILVSGEKVSATQTDNQNFSGEVSVIIDGAAAPVVDTIYAGSTLVDGSGTRNAEVMNKKRSVSTRVSDTSRWAVNVPEGEELVVGQTVYAMQSDGLNISEETPKEVVLLEKPKVYAVNPNDTQVIIDGTTNTTVEIKDAQGNIIGTGLVPTNNDNFAITLNDDVAMGDVLTIYATHNGAKSEEVHIIVGAALEAPTVNPVYPGDSHVTGEGVPGATITVTDPEGNVLGTGTVDPDGKFDVVVPEQELGNELVVNQEDGAGNTSPDANIVVGGTLPPHINPVSNSHNQITGTGTPNATVILYFENGLETSAKVDKNGNYVADVPNGSSTLIRSELVTARQTDGQNYTPVQRNMRTVRSLSINLSDPVAVVIDGADAPVFNTIYAGSTHVTGNGTPKAMVHNPSKTVVTDVKHTEEWIVEIPATTQLTVGMTVNAHQSDYLNLSPVTRMVVQLLEAPIVDAINPGDTSVIVDGTPGTTVVIEDANGVEIGRALMPTDAQNVSISINKELKVGDAITLYATHNGAVSDRVTVIVGITLEGPTVNPVNPGDTSVTGEGLPGANIVVTDPDGNVIGEGVVDPNGNFNVTIPPQAPGTELGVTQGDNAGNVSPETNVVVGGINKPTVFPVIEGQTNVTGTGTPNAEIVIRDENGVVIGTGTVDKDGNYDVTIVPQDAGDMLSVVQGDKAGNYSEPEYVLVEPTIGGPVLEAPTVNPVNPGDNSVTGEGEPGANIVVTDPDGNVIGEGVVNPDGTFEVAIPPQAPGTELGVTQEDNAGNKSPETNVVVGGIEKPTVDAVNPGQKHVTGTGTPNAEIIVRDENGEVIGTGYVKPNGTYDVVIVPQDAGDKLSVVQGDKAGNYSDPVYVIVGATLEGPVVNPVNPGDEHVTGEGMPGANIVVTDPDGNVIGEGVVGPDGTFDVTIPPQKPGTELGVTQEDNAGNKSPETNVVVGGIEKPTVDPVNPGDTHVTGTGTPNAEIIVRDENGVVIGTGTVKPDGTYDVIITPQDAGDKISVVQGDKAGNYSEPVYVIVGGTLPPKVDPVNPGDEHVTGEGTPGAEITVTDPDGNVIGEGIVGPDGKFDIVIPPAKEGDHYYVTQGDGAGNKSDATEVVVPAIAVATPKPTPKPTEKPKPVASLPVTGEAIKEMLVIGLSAILLAVLSMIFIIRRKRKHS